MIATIHASSSTLCSMTSGSSLDAEILEALDWLTGQVSSDTSLTKQQLLEIARSIGCKVNKANKDALVQIIRRRLSTIKQTSNAVRDVDGSTIGSSDAQ